MYCRVCKCNRISFRCDFQARTGHTLQLSKSQVLFIWRFLREFWSCCEFETKILFGLFGVASQCGPGDFIWIVFVDWQKSLLMYFCRVYIVCEKISSKSMICSQHIIALSKWLKWSVCDYPYLHAYVSGETWLFVDFVFFCSRINKNMPIITQ